MGHSILSVHSCRSLMIDKVRKKKICIRQMLEKRDCNGINQDITHTHTYMCVCVYVNIYPYRSLRRFQVGVLA